MDVIILIILNFIWINFSLIYKISSQFSTHFYKFFWVHYIDVSFLDMSLSRQSSFTFSWNMAAYILVLVWMGGLFSSELEQDELLGGFDGLDIF